MTISWICKQHKCKIVSFKTNLNNHKMQLLYWILSVSTERETIGYVQIIIIFIQTSIIYHGQNTWFPKIYKFLGKLLFFPLIQYSKLNYQKSSSEFTEYSTHSYFFINQDGKNYWMFPKRKELEVFRFWSWVKQEISKKLKWKSKRKKKKLISINFKISCVMKNIELGIMKGIINGFKLE